MLAKLTKALVAALVLAGVSTALATDAPAARVEGWYGSDAYMAPRHNPADTNGF